MPDVDVLDPLFLDTVFPSDAFTPSLVTTGDPMTISYVSRSGRRVERVRHLRRGVYERHAGLPGMPRHRPLDVGRGHGGRHA